MYTPLFSPLYYFLSVTDTPATRCACTTPARHPEAFAITHSPRLPSSAPLIHHIIGPALHIECTGDLQTSLLHFLFWTGPHIVFLMIISFSDLLIRHCDMRQFPPVTRLAPMRADQFQVIAPHG